jgi:hypothetical protein
VLDEAGGWGRPDGYSDGSPLAQSGEGTPTSRAARGETFETVVSVSTSNGERHAYEARGRPIGDGYAEGGVVVFRKLSNDAVQR